MALAALLGLAVLATWPGIARATVPGEYEGPGLRRGNPQALVGGTRRMNLHVQPAVLHPLNATDLYGNIVLDTIYETLTQQDVDSLRLMPLLAESWNISPDHKRFTFHINPAARWQDGQPVTAEDVKFSFDVLQDHRLRTYAKWASYFGNFVGAEVLDRLTVRFTARDDRYLNLFNLSALRIVPRHAFGTGDPNETPLAKAPLGSGPYRFEAWNRGQSIVLTRDPQYWGWRLPQNVGRYNAQRLLLRFIMADKVSLESFKRGDLDEISLKPEQWFNETAAPEFGVWPKPGSRFTKLEVRNQAPRPYRYVGWNLESPLFSDPQVRLALGLLFDRDTFIQKLFHGTQVKSVGPFEVGSRYSSPRIKPLGFSIPEAIHLLEQAGWKDSNGDGILDKNGLAFRFTVLTADPEDSVKLLTLAQASMRQAGVDMSIKVVDWSTLLSLIDDYRFDAVMLGWTRDVWPDPTPLWHSKSAVKGGLNLVRYRNPEVDRLIEEGMRSIPDSERVKLFRRLHEILFRDQPYTFLLEPDRSLLAYRNELRHAQPWYAYSVGDEYWWFQHPTQ